MFSNPTTHFHINVSWEWTYDGYHKGHKTKINQNMCGIMYYAMLYSISGRQNVLGFYNYLHTVTLAHMWLLNNLSSFVKNVIIVKHNTSAIGKTCPSVVLYCFLNYLRKCRFFKEIVIFQKSDPFFVLFQTAITFIILISHWKAMLFWKCLYPYFNFKWLFDVATEVKILLWHTYLKVDIVDWRLIMLVFIGPWWPRVSRPSTPLFSLLGSFKVARHYRLSRL